MWTSKPVKQAVKQKNANLAKLQGMSGTEAGKSGESGTVKAKAKGKGKAKAKALELAKTVCCVGGCGRSSQLAYLCNDARDIYYDF